MIRTRSIGALVLGLSQLAAQASWSHLYPANSPPLRAGASMACYEPTGAIVLFSGDAPGGAPLADTWQYVNDDWSEIVGATPPPRDSAAMVYDVAGQRIVLFGGKAPGAVPLDDTWAFDGVSWTQVATPVQPLARYDHALAYDRRRDVVVLFAGQNATDLQDTWELVGSTWTQRNPTLSPSARSHASMAFDPVNRDVLLHGGRMGQAHYNDTWHWDGTEWQQHLPLTPPPIRHGPAMCSDWHRQRVTLHGGSLADMFGWEWNGGNWELLLMASPGGRTDHALAYDPVRRRSLLHGGQTTGALFQDTWSFRTQTPAAVASFGVACPGSVGAPLLQSAPFELPWIGDTVHHVCAPLAASSLGAVFVTSTQPAGPLPLGPFGMPGCSLLVPLDIAEFRAASNQAASWQLQIPNNIALVGITLHQQAYVAEPFANPLGLLASNRLSFTTGRR